MPAHFHFSHGGEAVGLIPTRYPATDLARGDNLALARRTEWLADGAGGGYLGQGQRLLVTDGAEVGLMDVRLVEVDDLAEADDLQPVAQDGAPA
jgi:type VI secretion system protein ImpE